MAIASKKKRAARPARKAAAPKAPAAPVVDPLADVEAPDRSSPPLAEIDAEVLEFIAAIDRFKKENGRPFPSWSEVLLVLRELGYTRR